MKKALSLLLASALLFGTIPAALAVDDTAMNAAEKLHTLGLFQGKGNYLDGTPIYDLDAKPTRNEAVTMLVRLLGKENEAKTGVWDIPFTDVEDWAKPYVGYAYANGLTKGTGTTTFGGTTLTTASQYLTFVLRALGYDSSTDFQWDAAWVLSDALGITQGEYAADSADNFLRGDVAKISLSALPVAQKDSDEKLAEKLMREGAFSQESYSEVFPAETETETADYSPEAVYAKMIALKAELPEGTLWTNANTYVLTYPVDNNGYSYNYTYTGRGCVAFALKLSGAVFGDAPLRKIPKGEFTFEDLRPGDILRLNNDTHSVIILEKKEDSVVIAEGNYNSSVHWGRVLSQNEVMKADYIQTQYPEK